MSICYATTSGSSITFDSGYLVIQEKDHLITKLPINTLDSLVVFGRVQLSAVSLQELLKRSIPVSLFSKNGNYYGRLSSTSSSSAARIKLQVDRSRDTAFCLSLIRKIVEAKVNNQTVVLSRYAKGNCPVAIHRLKSYRQHILNAKTENELMGYEGMAAREYFQALSGIIREEFAFEGRNRQPPRDPFNSMISLGYTLLLYEIFGILENRNLSPYIGFYHKDSEKHPTLASDLLEEWRAPIVDATTLSILQQGKLSKENFHRHEENGGVTLDDSALRLYLRELEKKMGTSHKYLEYIKEETNFRRSISHQVNGLIRALEENNADYYMPIRIR